LTTLLCLATIFVVAVSGQTFPSLLTRLGGSPVQQGLLLASLFLFFPASAAGSGYLADRLGKRPVVAAGIAVGALPFALSALLPGLWTRILAVLLFGAGAGAVESQSSALLSDLHPRRERSVLNLSQTLFSAGAAGGPFLIAVVGTLGGGISLPVLLWAVAGINGLLCLGFLLPARPQLRTSPAGPAPGQPQAELRTVRALLARPLLRWLLAAIFLYAAAEMGTAGWLAKYGQLYLGLSAELAPVCISLYWGGVGVSRVLVGLLSARVGDRALLLASLGLSAAAQLASFLLHTPAAALGTIALLGFAMGCVWPTLVAMAGAQFRSQSGTAIGLMVASGALAIPVVQLLMGLISQPRLLGLRGSLLCVAVLPLVDLLVVARLRPGKPEVESAAEPGLDARPQGPQHG
jgi:MFS family permease